MKKRKVNLRDIDTQNHKGEHSHDDGHSHGTEKSSFKTQLPAIISFSMLMIGYA